MIAFMIFGACVLFGSGCSSELNKQRNETRAMSFLKKYQIAASLYQVEYGRYASLKEVYEDGSSGVIDKEFYQAWDGHNSPQPLSGYLFSSVDQDSEGGALDRTDRAGLCAYPENPGGSGDLIICTLSDPGDFKAEEIEGGFISHGEEWSFYVANYADLGKPLRKWPSAAMIKKHFTKLQKRNPSQGLEEARTMAEGVQNK